MHIAVDATSFSNQRGYGRHARALISALLNYDQENKYTLITDSELEGFRGERIHHQHVYTSQLTTEAAAANGRRSLRDMWRMSRALSQPSFDIILFPTVYSYVPVFSKAKVVVFIHDVIPERFPELTHPTTTSQLFWLAKSKLARRQADGLVTVSAYSKNAIVETFGLSPERIYVVGEASDPIFRVLENPQMNPALAQIGILKSDRVIAYVGGFGPHKNLDMLISTFAQLTEQDEFSNVRLVMVGEYKQETFYSTWTDLSAKIENLKLSHRVVFTGFLPDEELVSLLNTATVLVLPSLMEGFGLPAVEASACGCPVIATNASPLPALLGEAGIYFDPNSQDELEAALTLVLQSESTRLQMRQAGLQAIKKLTWETAAIQLIEVFKKVFQDEPSA